MIVTNKGTKKLRLCKIQIKIFAVENTIQPSTVLPTTPKEENLFEKPTQDDTRFCSLRNNEKRNLSAKKEPRS